ncbi:MAG: hypothetical protein KDA63_11175, partial [Planctomycetales bacterium]|nr:hypothetical protein [Planctomycetales bacterium]
PVVLRAGVAERDVTPQAAVPMWGYGARHAMLSDGVLDPLSAKAIVLAAGDDKLALVATDLGRGPTPAMMATIRSRLADVGIEHVIVTGSHSHHGPVIELTDRPGFGGERFPDAVAYSARLPELIVEAVLEANDKLVPVVLAVAKRDVGLNRNRHWRGEAKPTDPQLLAVRIDTTDGEPLAVLVNFAAHPVMTDTMQLKFSADYPGYLKHKIEAEHGGMCLFFQGAAGDMSTNPPSGVRGPQEYGEHLAGAVLEMIDQVEPAALAKPTIAGKVHRALYDSRVDFTNPFVLVAYSQAFFPELIRNYAEENARGIPTEVDTVLLGDEIAIVSGSGEFFCNHAVRLRERLDVPNVLFLGYANGHNLYFPTIEAASMGGYGAGPEVSPVAVGAGEELMNEALVNCYQLLGRLPDSSPADAVSAADTAPTP